MSSFSPRSPACRIVSREEWVEARRELLEREKEATRLRDQLAAQRRELPWVKIDKEYSFKGADGRVTLSDLFAGKRQLVVYHFMFGPDWKEGCPSCSFVADHLVGAVPHLAARDVSLVLVSRAAFARLEAFRRRMGWPLKWVSSRESDFNFDFQVSFRAADLPRGPVTYNYELQEFPSQEAPGISVFYRDSDGGIYHTYSAYARGCEPLIGAYAILDLAPKGRDEEGLSFSMEWVRYHDRYGTNDFADADKPYWPEAAST